MNKTYCKINLSIAKRLLIAVCFFMISLQGFSTHNRAGEITYRQISDLTYEITVITYTATGPNWTADRPELEVAWGDNTSTILPRTEEVYLPDFYKRNKYVGLHTYGGVGIFVITVEDPNRNANVQNIPNSVNTMFAISTTMIVDPTLGYNNTPILTQAPIDKAAVGQIFIHNPGAFDPDGDSLSFKITQCREENGLPIPNYTYPPASEYITVNEITGDLVWKTPVFVGVYNVAMLIEEWRNGIKIGEIIRDMQIEVYDSGNQTPEVVLPNYPNSNKENSICIEADSLLSYTITARDANNDTIDLSASGAPFVADENATAVFQQNTWQAGSAEGIFKWQTNCNIVRSQPYILNIKAQDRNDIVNLVDIESVYITIVGPEVENVQANAGTQNILLSWNSCRCENIIGYNIYRKISPSGYIHNFCQVGVPDSIGYTKITYIEGRDNTIYEDNDVSQGHEYCYIICAVFPDKTEGYASDEICSVLTRGIPTITNVSVTETDRINGSVFIAWAKPNTTEIGTATGPFQYVLYRSTGFLGETLEEIATLNDINDTTFNDTNINTIDNSYSYKVEFYNNAEGNRYLIGSPNIASSVFIDFIQMESSLKINIRNKVPWINNEYEIYRYDGLSDQYNYLNNTSEKSYTDYDLVNGVEYCYYVKSVGSYTIAGLPSPLINLSQKSCKYSVDTTAPCTPILSVKSECDSMYNSLSWYLPDTCNYDVKKFILYYTPELDGQYEKIAELDSSTLSYMHIPTNGMSGCYYITAIDKFDNTSNNSNVICVDACTYYELPNVFTPNNDNINDFYHPIKPYYFVDKVDATILNRWGQVMFQTQDPDIMWDGRNQQNGKLVVPGVYFYIVDVYEQRLTGVEIRHLKGFIHVFENENTNNTRD